MKFYPILRWFLFLLDPETAHKLVLNSLRFIPACCFKKAADNPVEVMGIQFPNRVGLAAGFDRHGSHIDALAKLGFGFIEVGTITVDVQQGNPRPRIFRLPSKQALINRLGFYNNGLNQFIENMQKTKYRGVLGVNIVKNFNTPIEDALNDYLICFRGVYPFASYIAINISSPNTPNLRKMQYGELLDDLLATLKDEQKHLQQSHGKFVPFVIKVAPDLSSDEVKKMSELFLKHQVDGVIATNTTISREGVEGVKHSEEKGGLSGAPLTQQATEVLKQFHACLGDKIPIIAVGGIMNADNAAERLSNGASLVEVYTGLIYKGPNLISEIIEAS